MGFLWLNSSVDPRQAEYARAYDRAIKTGSLDSAISWELGGFLADDGTIVTNVPEEVKATLRKNPKYEQAVKRVDVAVKALRESRSTIGISSHMPA